MTTNREITTTNIIEELHIAHEQLVGGLRDTFEAALEIGRLLTDQKASLAHGQFLPWLEKNVAFISESTCRRCMRLHRNREMLKSVNVTDLSSAYKLLAAPKQSDDDVVEAAEAPCAEAVAPIDRDQLNRRRLRQKKHDMVKAELATMRAKADALEVEVVDHGGDEIEVVKSTESGPIRTSCALQYAGFAMNQLTKILRIDQQREEAVATILEWVIRELAPQRAKDVPCEEAVRRLTRFVRAKMYGQRPEDTE